MRKVMYSFIVGMLCCHSSVIAQVVDEQASEIIDSAEVVQSLLPPSFDIREECIRGEAEPVLRTSVFPTAHFERQADSLTGIETAILENGDKLTLKNWGCEYFVLTFRIETSRYAADPASLKYWYVAAYKLMKELEPGIDAPIDIKKGLEAFNKHISKNVFDLEMQTEIDFGGNEIRDFVTLDLIEKLSDKNYAITISFAVGPL